MGIVVTNKDRRFAGELVRHPDGEFSAEPVGTVYEELDTDLRQYLFYLPDGTTRLATYARYDFIGCDADAKERGLRRRSGSGHRTSLQPP